MGCHGSEMRLVTDVKCKIVPEEINVSIAISPESLPTCLWLKSIIWCFVYGSTAIPVYPRIFGVEMRLIGEKNIHGESGEYPAVIAEHLFIPYQIVAIRRYMPTQPEILATETT